MTKLEQWIKKGKDAPSNPYVQRRSRLANSSWLNIDRNTAISMQASNGRSMAAITLLEVEIVFKWCACHLEDF